MSKPNYNEYVLSVQSKDGEVDRIMLEHVITKDNAQTIAEVREPTVQIVLSLIDMHHNLHTVQ